MPQGKLLALPVNTAAVFTPRNGEPKVYWEGVNYLKGIGLGMHYFNCVNLQTQHIRGLEVKATSQDGWDVTLHFDIFWRVRDVIQILRMRGAETMLISNVLSAVADLVRSMMHDEFIQMPNSNCQMVNSGKIAAWLLSMLNSQPLADGVEVLVVNVVNRHGDRRRTDVIQRAIIEWTEIQQNKQLMKERNDLETIRLEQQAKLLDQKQTLAVREAEIYCSRIAAEEQVRLAKAKIAQQEAESLYQVRLKEVKIQNLAVEQQQMHERAMKRMECDSKLLAEMLRTWAENAATGLTRPMDPAIQQVFVQVLREITAASRAGMPREFGSRPPVEPGAKTMHERDLKEPRPIQ